MATGNRSRSLRAVLARESDRGLETLAGEIVSARAVAFEVLVTALDDLSLARTTAAGVGLLDASSGNAPPAVPAVRSPGSIPSTRSSVTASPTSPGMPMPPAPPSPPVTSAMPSATPSSWASAAEASHQVERAATTTVQMPQKPVRPGVDLDTPSPEPGDVVDHFAFGRADVIKSDGDRLHLRVHKDGRIREIALEMLRVTRLDGDGPVGATRRFKLERRL